MLVLLRLLGAERGTALLLLVGALPAVLLGSYAVLGIGLGLRRPLLATAGAALVVAHLLVVAPAVREQPLPDGAADAPRLRVVTANLYVLNDTPEQAGRVLRGLRPDVLVVPELDRRGIAGLRAAGLLEDLPHAVVRLEAREETVGLLSRLPLRDVSLRATAGRVLPRATVEVGGVAVRLLPMHAVPPVWVLEPLWRGALDDLRREVGALDLPAVVAGDLNADRDHAALRALLDVGLRDAHDERGRGLARTWPAALPLLHLDHVLLRDGAAGRVSVLAVREVEIPGSDHLAVVADLAVQPGCC